MSPARLVGFIMRRELSGERFYLINPTDATTLKDAKHRNVRMTGYSPELRKTATVICEARPFDGRD